MVRPAARKAADALCGYRCLEVKNPAHERQMHPGDVAPSLYGLETPRFVLQHVRRDFCGAGRSRVEATMRCVPIASREMLGNVGHGSRAPVRSAQTTITGVARIIGQRIPRERIIVVSRRRSVGR